jgi:cellulose synthase operon protein C
MNPCDNLISFVDGQLDADDAEAFRAHLRTCEACPDNLIEAVQLSAHLSTLPPPTPSTRVPAPPPPPAELPGTDDGREPQASMPMNSSSGATATPVIPTHEAIKAMPPPASWKRAVGWSMGLAAIFATAIAGWPHHRAPPGISAPSNPTVVDVFAGLESQPYEVRLAYPGAAAKRPVRDAMLGSGAAPKPSAIPLDAVAALQQRGDQHGVAIASLWNGSKPNDVSMMLNAIEQTEPVRSDRAAMAVLTTNAANAEPVLAELESLRHSKDELVARAARWNHALVLARLDLPLAAAQAFRAIADEHEAGWADAAAERAKQLSRLGDDLHTKWQQACAAGEALLEAGTPVPRTLVGEFPGVLRAYFYNAVRTAPSAARVRALAPMAAQLDQLGDPGQHILTDYVQRVARLDFTRRAPLAAGYAALLRDAPVPDPIAAQLTTETDDAAVADIVMGAMVERSVQGDVIMRHRRWFRRRVNQYKDPWFQLVLPRAEVDAGWTVDAGGKAGNRYRAQTILHQARELCTPALRYQCLELDRYLGEVYADLHQVPASLTLLRRTVADARAAGEWGRYQKLLMELADVERFHGATATVRAYASELLLMSTTCKDYKLIYRRLAGAAILDTDGRAARDYLAQAMALPCAEADLATAISFSDIATLDPRPDDLARLQRMLEALPETSKATAADQAFIAALEGRVAIATRRDRAGGVALLEKAIASADARRGDVNAEKARAAAYNMLAFDAAQRDDLTGALNLVARDLRPTPPGDCSVAMAAEGKRAVIVVRGADGKDRGRYFPERLRQDGALSVPADLAQGLSGCQRVGVMASAALQGQPGVLPAELAWSYAVQAVERGAASNPPPDERHTLIVTNVTPPPYLELQPLSTQPPDDVSATTLSGAAATPARVLTAMGDATEIQFHTHALLDVGVSDASYLVLSPEEPVRNPPAGRADPPYALTAEAIRGAKLRRRPIVVLEACHSAVGARYEHEPWSLPDAFFTAGARAVFAAATEIPDVASGQFFARVLARVRDGAAPAVALRDERIAALRKEPHNPWVASVILFE